LKIAILHHARKLDEAVREGRFAMIDMGDYTEIANVVHRTDRVQGLMVS
jgi:hypothetical protein